MTRQNAIPIERNNNNETSKSDSETNAKEITQMPALIPFWDFANHKNGIVTTSYNAADEQIEGATFSDVQKGEQIFIYYGNRNNANLLVHNGFVIENNQSDNVVIRLGLSQTDPLVKQRSKLLDSIGIAKNTEITIIPAPKFISPELLAFVRVFNMNEEQLNHWLIPDKCATDLLYLDCALDTALEMKTWQFLKMRLTLLLNAFPTSIAYDENLLEQHHRKGHQKLSHIKTNIIQYRCAEKRMLSEALNYIEERIKP